MDLLWVILGSFLIGAVGALFIVWLRWIGSLPKFSSVLEIQGCENEYKDISDHISAKVKNKEKLDDAEIQHSNNLRDDIWRQRKQSFVTSALLYTALGGASAVLFAGIGTQDILDPTAITKLLAAGALWTTFYSFIDVKKTSSIIYEKAETVDKKAEDMISNLNVQLQKEQEKVLELATRYNDAVEAYEAATKKTRGTTP